MKAAVFHKPRDIRTETVKDPEIQHPRDVILKVTATAICGSDLHIYNGYFPQLTNLIMGHEFMGVVEEVGKDIKNLRRGDRVVVPFPIACGQCFFCERGLPPHCERSNPEHYGPEGGMASQKGGALFGYTDLYGGYSGGQAELVRVPFADYGPRKVPDGLTDEQVLFLTDIYPTGYSAIDWAQVKGGETVAVFGAGPVGIMTAKAAWVRGAKRVVIVDIQQYRLDMAAKAAKCETINAKECDPIEVIRSMTEGHGADVCVDAVGMEAEHSLLESASNLLHMQVGSMKVLRNCISAVRRGGTVSILGVYGVPYDNFPIGQLFDKGVKLVGGQALVHRYIDDLLKQVKEEKVVLDDIITHRIGMDEISQAYSMFNRKEDGCVKVVIKP
jgi:S-(hydroxymethyl)glutathione dehydrogenase/alcohol dehydrogenase